MDFLGKIIDVTMKKQQESMQSFEGGSFLGNTKSLPEILEDILKRLPHHFGDSLGSHIGHISQHLTENSPEELKMQQIEGPVDSQQEKPFDLGKEELSQGKEEELPSQAEQDVTQNEHIQEDAISVVPSPTMSNAPVPIPQVVSSRHDLFEEGLLQGMPERQPSREISFDLTLDISTNQRISYLQKITTAVSKKHEEYLQKAEPSLNKIMSQRQPSTTQFLTKLNREFAANLEQKMLPHIQNLHQYLFPAESRPRNIKIEKIVESIHNKQGKCLQTLRKNFKSMCEFELEIDTDRIVERKVRREEAAQVVVKTEVNQSQTPPMVAEKEVLKHPHTEGVRVEEVSHEVVQEVGSPIPAITKIERLQTVEVIGSEIENPKIGTVPLDMSQSEPNIIKTRILSRPHENLETRIQIEQPSKLASSDLIVKRDIVKELEERRRKIREHELKSKKLKTKLIRLEPIASKEQRLAKEKEARQKINAAVDFVQNLDHRKKSTNFKITEWKQEKNHRNHEKTEFTPNKYNHSKHLQSFNGGASRLHDSFEGDSYINSSLRDPSRDGKNFTLRKPVPYNLYNVNCKEHEVFKFSNQ